MLAPRARNHIHYAIVPKQRGTFSLDWVWVGLNSRLGLWSKTLKFSLSETISVYPALKQISRYALYSRLNRMSLLGVRKVVASSPITNLKGFVIIPQMIPFAPLTGGQLPAGKS